ncbi:MAG: methyltransferase domain-containing protein [Methylococcales bacterium]
MNVDSSVLKRYSEGAGEKQENLCCPVEYDTRLLEQLPQEIVDKDYGCGDPSRYVREGDTVLDLGSGSGKICYIAAQLVGNKGRVIGVDMNNDMLALARKYQREMAEKIGSDRVTFHKGHIQDLALNMDSVETYLSENPINSVDALTSFQTRKENQRRENPLIPDNSVDLVISNCVLNLVQDSDKEQMVREIFRVLKPGGRIAISDIVSDEPIPAHLKQDPDLWSGCISGALEENAFLQAFADSGFTGSCYANWVEEPWQVVENIEFRSVTVTAVKPSASEAIDRGHAVIYRGPFSEIKADNGQIFPRGERMAVSEADFHLLTSSTYQNSFIELSPAKLIAPKPYTLAPGTRRSPTETKNSVKTESQSGSCCCG